MSWPPNSAKLEKVPHRQSSIAWTGVYILVRHGSNLLLLHPPHTDLVPPTTEPLPTAAPLAPALPSGEAPRVNSSHFYMYVPSLKSEQEQHAMRLVLRANQFPNDPAMCNRTLHLYDDALTAGLGYTARLIALALLVAVQEKRVLILVPHASARWCAREPYTLGCYYEPITHCTYRPDWQNISFKWSTRGSSFGLEGRRAMSAPIYRYLDQPGAPIDLLV